MCSFSIIIPVFNTEKYLKECVESILNQSNKNFEVILIDDVKKYYKSFRKDYIKLFNEIDDVDIKNKAKVIIENMENT